MSDYVKTFAVIDETMAAADAMVAVRERKYYFSKLKEYAQALFDRGPFKVGDRVRMTLTPRIDKEHAWGWLRAKHFMVKGAIATVRSVDFNDGHFNALVVFDDETYLSEQDGQKHPVKESGLYCLWDTQIEKVIE